MNNFEEQFLEKAKIKHNNFYNYTKVNYIDAHTHIIINCPIHGDFSQKPHNHLYYGCKECAIDKRRLNTEQFIEKAKLKHGDFYDYSKTIYVESKKKVIIICPIHKEFTQRPNNHLNGNICPYCDRINNRIRTIKRIEENKLNGYQLYPNFNKNACKKFDDIMLKENIFIQHAMNGGEYYIKELGYWLDGYDKENNTVYEFDEEHHFDKQGNLKEKDKFRENEIIYILKCKFIRIKK